MGPAYQKVIEGGGSDNKRPGEMSPMWHRENLHGIKGRRHSNIETAYSYQMLKMFREYQDR
jgi:hypothetical protein